MAIFENAMKMFTPFYSEDGQGGKATWPGAAGMPGMPSASTDAVPKAEDGGKDIDDLRQQMLDMQKKLDRLSGSDD